MGIFNQPRQIKTEVLPPVVEQELVFHNTVPIEEEKLPEAREKARSQKEKVLEMFRISSGRNFTPFETFEMIKNAGGCAVLTSIRRCISDLAKEGKLIKCQWSESRKGEYGTLNRVWKFNNDYAEPITPKK